MNQEDKVAIFESWLFQEDDEIYGDELTEENCHLCVGADTSIGIVAGTYTFTNVIEGDEVIVRKGASYAYSLPEYSKWVMVGFL
jgi:hypothetical protein